MQPHNAINTPHHVSFRMLVRCVVLLAVLIIKIRAWGQEPNNSDILTCETATNAHIGQPGITYAGAVSNGDYRFDAKIPEGLIGLGSAPGAPFHGFAIFIDKSSCIVFMIHHRVLPLTDDTPPAPTYQKKLARVQVGNRKGFEMSMIGATQGRRYLNTNVLVDLPRSGYENDVSITFVTPTENRSTTEPIFREFLDSFWFW